MQGKDPQLDKDLGRCSLVPKEYALSPEENFVVSIRFGWTLVDDFLLRKYHD
jgi:hypothetical protein